jgi:hypothetical protein
MNLPSALSQAAENKRLLHEARLILRGRPAGGSANTSVTPKDSLAQSGGGFEIYGFACIASVASLIASGGDA